MQRQSNAIPLNHIVDPPPPQPQYNSPVVEVVEEVNEEGPAEDE